MILLQDLIMEGSILKNPLLDKISKDLIKDLKTFFKNRPVPEMDSNAELILYQSKHKYTLKTYKKQNNTFTLYFNVYAETYENQAGNFKIVSDEKVEINLFLNKIIPNATNDLFDDQKRLDIFKHRFQTIAGIIYHEVQHLLKSMIFGYMRDLRYKQQTDHYHGNKNSVDIDYFKISDEWESLLSTIKHDIMYYFSNKSHKTKNLMDALSESEFRRVVGSMLDKALVLSDYRKKTLDSSVFDIPTEYDFDHNYFNASNIGFPDSNFPRTIGVKNITSPKLVKYINPKYIKIYKVLLKKLTEWFLDYKKKEKLKVSPRTPVQPANFEFK